MDVEFDINPNTSSLTVTLKVDRLTYNRVEQTVEIESVKSGELVVTTYTVEGLSGTNVGEYTVEVTGTGNFAGAKGTVTFTIDPKAITESMVSGVEESYEFTGSAIEPEVTVTDGVELEAGVEYTVSYGDNINVASGGSVTVSGTGNYTGTVTKNFTIRALTSELTVELSKVSLTYTGVEQFITVVKVTSGELELLASEYEVSGETSGTNVGTYEVVVSGKGNYLGAEGRASYVIVAKGMVNNETVTIDAIGSIEYTGAEIRPSVTVRDIARGEVIDATEYEVSYSSNINAGTATVTIVGKAGSNYSGTVSTTFEITKATLTVNTGNATMTYGEVSSLTEYTYTVSGWLGQDIGNNEGLVEETSLRYEILDELGAVVTVNETTARGTYYIHARGLSSANYNFEEGVVGTLEIIHAGQGELVCSLASNTIAYGEIVECTVTGGSGTGAISAESKNEEVAVVSVNGNILTIEIVNYTGEATIEITKAGDDNFEAISKEIVVKATTKELVVTANGQEVTYGETIKSGVEYVTVEGLVKEDKLTAVTLSTSDKCNRSWSNQCKWSRSRRKNSILYNKNCKWKLSNQSKRYCRINIWRNRIRRL